MAQRSKAYSSAIEQLEDLPGWENHQEAQQQLIKAPLAKCAVLDPKNPIDVLLLRADLDAVQSRYDKAVQAAMEVLEGERVVRVKVSDFFKGGIDTEEQLEAALSGLREECESLIGAGKKILVQRFSYFSLLKEEIVC